tara:strand:+ start:90 stop:1070 length:981 start_codon:yes stop_codon:yes gene_type:complete
MNIKFLLPKARAFIEKGKIPKRASQRFRGLVPLQHMLSTDGYIDRVEEATKDDIVIMSKAIEVKDFLYLKDKGIKFIFDICDNKWRIGKDRQKNTAFMNAGCLHANLITTTSGELKQKILEETGKVALIVDDPFERVIEEPKFKPQKKNLNICYFGGRKSFWLVNWEEVIAGLNYICGQLGMKYTLNCITQKHLLASKKITHHYYPDGPVVMYEWNYELQRELVSKSDFVLLPIPNDNPLVFSYKSPNRVIDSIAQGRYVITTNGVTSYEQFGDFIGIGSLQKNIKWAMENPKGVISKIKEGQNYIQKYHSPEVIAKQWMDLRNKI